MRLQAVNVLLGFYQSRVLEGMGEEKKNTPVMFDKKEFDQDLKLWAIRIPKERCNYVSRLLKGSLSLFLHLHLMILIDRRLLSALQLCFEQASHQAYSRGRIMS